MLLATPWCLVCTPHVSLRVYIGPGNRALQGPFSHIAAIACHKLWRLPYFRVIRGNYALRRQVIAAGELLQRLTTLVACPSWLSVPLLARFFMSSCA